MKWPKKKDIIDYIGIFLGSLGLASFIIYSIKKVLAGHGLDDYFTGFGVRMSYVGFVVTMAIIPVAILMAWIISRWLKKRKNLTFNRKIFWKQNRKHFH
jgi:hypothetical protein